MSDSYNDGGLQTGSRILTIGKTWNDEDAKAYVATSFSVNRPSSTIEQRDQDNKPSKQKSEAGFVTGSATLQFPDAKEWGVQFGWEFRVSGLETNDAGEDVTETFYIDSVGRSESQGAERQQNITFRKKLNA